MDAKWPMLIALGILAANAPAKQSASYPIATNGFNQRERGKVTARNTSRCGAAGFWETNP